MKIVKLYAVHLLRHIAFYGKNAAIKASAYAGAIQCPALVDGTVGSIKVYHTGKAAVRRPFDQVERSGAYQ